MRLARFFWPLFLLYSLCAGMTSALAQPVESGKGATPLDARIDQIIPLLLGRVEPEAFFDPRFLAQVASAPQMKGFAQSVIAQAGKPQEITEIRKESQTVAALKVKFEKAVLVVDVSIDPAPPHRIIGFRITPEQPIVKNDSLAKIDAELAALPGRAGYTIQTLGEDGERSVIAGRAGGEAFAIGSIFKLYILAELASQIDAGKRKWSDVIPLTRRSFSSSATQHMALGTPVMLEQLATWMIAVSDNAATDELLFLLGRAQIEARVRIIGHSAPERMFPFLSTVEAFLLKSDYKGMRARYISADEAGRRAILKRKVSGAGYEKIKLDALIGKPAAIDSIEWFASPDDIVMLMDHLRRMNNQTVFNIMAKSVSPAAAKPWAYLGSKGGSELGVIAMSFLAEAPSGQWSVVTGSWNNSEQAVDDNKFIALMIRALNIVAEKK